EETSLLRVASTAPTGARGQARCSRETSSPWYTSSGLSSFEDRGRPRGSAIGVDHFGADVTVARGELVRGDFCGSYRTDLAEHTTALADELHSGTRLAGPNRISRIGDRDARE